MERRDEYNMLLPCETILEESEGFHLKKKKHKKPKNKQLVTSLPIIPVILRAVRMGSKGWHPLKVEESEQGKDQ